jgi:hypothetical protein
MRKKLTDVDIQVRLMELGLIQSDGKPVLYTTFKNRATIMRSKQGNGVKKAVFIGLPKENLFGFYAAFLSDPDSMVMKEAYAMFLKLAKGDMEDYENDNVQWGNRGIPINCGNLRRY